MMLTNSSVFYFIPDQKKIFLLKVKIYCILKKDETELNENNIFPIGKHKIKTKFLHSSSHETRNTEKITFL